MEESNENIYQDDSFEQIDQVKLNKYHRTHEMMNI